MHEVYHVCLLLVRSSTSKRCRLRVVVRKLRLIRVIVSLGSMWLKVLLWWSEVWWLLLNWVHVSSLRMAIVHLMRRYLRRAHEVLGLLLRESWIVVLVLNVIEAGLHNLIPLGFRSDDVVLLHVMELRSIKFNIKSVGTYLKNT